MPVYEAGNELSNNLTEPINFKDIGLFRSGRGLNKDHLRKYERHASKFIGHRQAVDTALLRVRS